MKRFLSLVITSALLLSFSVGCGKSTDADSSSDNGNGSSGNAAGDTFEPQHKTESETVNITAGMIPQTLEKSVTYVQKTEGGAWEEESTEISKWEIADGFDLADTVWMMTADDATTLVTPVDEYFSGRACTLYIHFGNEIKNVQTQVGKTGDGKPILDITLSTTVDIFFESWGTKLIYEGIPVTGAEAYEDGTLTIKGNAGEMGDVMIHVPSDVQSSTWKDLLIAESDTYIANISFDTLPSFEVTSPNVTNGIWDEKITNTKYGENMSPELKWDAVDGATQYVVIMIDGSWLHMDVFTTETSLAAGSIEKGERGAQYVGPYPPANAPHTYTIFVFALKADPSDFLLLFDMSNNSIDKIYTGLDTDASGNTGNVLAYGRLDGNYTYPG